jgi:prefoldin subunit 5
MDARQQLDVTIQHFQQRIESYRAAITEMEAKGWPGYFDKRISSYTKSINEYELKLVKLMKKYQKLI